MKPTQEQIDAALQIADNSKEYYPNSVPAILAAAYREKCEECDELKYKLSIAMKRLEQEA